MALTVSKIADALAYSKSHVLNLIKAGELTPLPRNSPRGKYLIDEAEFARYQEKLASRDATGREFAYIILNRNIGQLPDTFDRSRVDRSVGDLAAELSGLSHALGHLKHPYHYWSGMLQEIGAFIETLRQSDLFRIMLTKDSMKLLPVLERDLRLCIRRLRDDLLGKQDPAITRDILLFRDMMQKWSEFCAGWSDLRDTAAKCFSSRRSDEKYGELKHPASVVVYDPYLKTEFIWNAFGLVSRPLVVNSVAGWITHAIGFLGWQFDTICSISAAALQLSSFIAVSLQKNVVALDNQTFEFQPPQPPGTSYVFVDTVCQTGNHLLESINRATDCHKNVAGAIFITVNDMMPENHRRKRLQIIDDMQKEGRLIYCYDLSYLHERLQPTYLAAADSEDR